MFDIRLKTLTLQKTKSQDQAYRPIEAVTTRVSANLIGNIVETNQSNGTSVASMSHLAPEVLRLSNPDTVSVIQNGWGTERYKFVLICLIRSGASGVIEQYKVQGYTDIAESNRGGINPDTIFYINAVSSTSSKHQKHNPLVKSRQVITGVDSNVPFNIAVQRPYDVIRRDSDEYNSAADPFMGDYGYTNVKNNVNVVSATKPELSDVDNQSPTSYLAKIFGTLQEAASVNSMNLANEDNRMCDASELIHNDTLSTDNFVMALNQKCEGLLSSNAFRASWLNSIDPTFLKDNSRCRIINNYTIGESEYMNSTTADSYAATAIHNYTMSIMKRFNLGSIDFVLSNASGEYSVTIKSAMSDTIDDNNFVKRMANAFVMQFKTEAMNYITNNNVVKMSATVSAQVSSKTTINITLDGVNYTPYEFQSYADSLFSPVVSPVNPNSTEDNTIVGSPIVSIIRDAYSAMDVSLGKIEANNVSSYIKNSWNG